MHDAELTELLDSPLAADELAGPAASVVVVEPGGPAPDQAGCLRLRSLPCVVIAVDRPPGSAPPPFADLVVEEPVSSVDEVLAVVDAHPFAATALVLLLRSGPLGVPDGLVAESAVYSMLQGGSELSGWLAARPVRHRPPLAGAVVRVERTGGRLDLVLDRPEVRNALDATMRDELVAALSVAAADADVTEVVIRGAGPDFCAGGDLDEFGSFVDPASAHVTRLARNVGRALHAVRERTTVMVHGRCAGSGIELPAFAHRVVAAPSFRASLPEVTMGLIPGAGGTVSIPARIGRHRTALLALSGAWVDAPLARRWGLVDEISDWIDRPVNR